MISLITSRGKNHAGEQVCLGKVRDGMAKRCRAVEELTTLLKNAEEVDKEVLRRNGLI